MGPSINYLIALHLFSSATLENKMIPNVTLATKKIDNQRKQSFYLVQKNGIEKVWIQA